MSQLPPLNRPQKVPVARLDFDPFNPRFTPDMDIDTTSITDIVRELDRRADLAELIQSIAASGYVDIEPLVVMSEGDRLLVLEGNRRLAALKILASPELAAEAGVKLPEMDSTKRATLAEVTVYRVPDRAAAQDFIGFKHINGPHRWDSYAKASFAARWLANEQRQGSGVTLRDIARRMGDRHDTIKRMVAGYFVLEQATRERLFEVQDRYAALGPLAFSHLYIGLTRPTIREYLGLPDDARADDPIQNPVPRDHLPELEQLLSWLFGSKRDDQPPIVTSQNPHVKQLAEVLGNPKARAMLVTQGNLRIALAQVEKASDAFERALTAAHNHLEVAQGKLDSYDGTSKTMLEIAGDVQSKSEFIFRVMSERSDRQDAPRMPVRKRP